jgi:hypothetical protein
MRTALTQVRSNARHRAGDSAQGQPRKAPRNDFTLYCERTLVARCP